MPRISSTPRDIIRFDTVLVEPGKEFYLFGNENLGDKERCNLFRAGTLSEHELLISSMGVRALGLSLQEEKMVFERLVVRFMVGDRPLIELTGPCMTNLLDTQITGFVFRTPFRIPYQQHVRVSVWASKELMVPVEIRVLLHGLEFPQ